jgi:hypothetical protein
MHRFAELSSVLLRQTTALSAIVARFSPALWLPSTSHRNREHIAKIEFSAQSGRLEGIYFGIAYVARLWSSAVLSNSVLARSRAFISL